MKFYISGLVLFLFLLSSCEFIRKWQTKNPDNPVEEVIEEIIEENTGYEMDLTPFSPEEESNNNKKKSKYKEMSHRQDRWK